MRLLFTIKPDDGDPYEVTADSRDIIAWEDGKAGRKSTDLMSGNYGMKDLTEIAYRSARRSGHTTEDLKAFRFSAAVESGHTLPKPNDEEDAGTGVDPTPTDH